MIHWKSLPNKSMPSKNITIKLVKKPNSDETEGKETKVLTDTMQHYF